jgi:adenine-specific DNA-methyltransferase
MNGLSLTPEAEKIKALQEILPEVFTEGKIDWEKLKATLGEDINFSNERYVLNWAGKSDAFKVLQTPTSKTLVPAKDESVNFDETENIFIEGENLEVLKVLQKSYFGKVKMIYIDPPYNTGNDSFIYPDKFSETKDEYQRRVGDKDEEGYMTKDGMFRKNSKENGQYHSNWLNMMMPRLYLAKNLLRQDGVIFISIDDNEVHNLRLLMNEIFGEENFVAQIVWAAGKKNDSKLISNSHEYILVYVKNKTLLDANNILWRQRKKGIDDIYKRYNQLKSKYKNDFSTIETEMKRWFSELSNDNPAKRHKHYSCVDEKGLFFPDNISWPGGGGPKYEVIHPKTGKAVKVPSRGWMYSSPDRMNEIIQQNLVHFGDDENFVPCLKSYLNDREFEVPYSVFYQDGRAATKRLRNLMSEDFFDHPKDEEILQELIEFSTQDGDIVLDFFVGSGTLAHSVFKLNYSEISNRTFIVVQLPELCEENSKAKKFGFETISDIAKDRIRKAGEKVKKEIQNEINNKLKELENLKSEIPTKETLEKIKILEVDIGKLRKQDLGFKVLKLNDSNFKQWQQIEGQDVNALVEQMMLFVDPVAESSTIENMTYELMLKSGKDLKSKIEANDGYFAVNTSEMVLILEKANQEIIEKVIALRPLKVIALDKLFKGNDQLKTNTVLQMKDAGIEFKTI